MDQPQDVIIWSNRLLDYLLEYREQHPEFTFWLRQRDRGDRLSNGYWFQGNDNYIFLSFWSRSGGTNMTRSIGFVLYLADDGNHTTGMEVVFNGEQDQKLIELYRKIIVRFHMERQHDTKFRLAFEEKDVIKSLDLFLSQIKPTIDEMVRQVGKQEIFISEEQFKENLEKIKLLKHRGGKSTTIRAFEDWVNEYKKLISGQMPELEYNELYKWKTVQYFQTNWKSTYDTKNIYALLKSAFNKENNNLWSGQNYFPFRMLLRFAEKAPQKVVDCLINLYNEAFPLRERISAFKKSADEMLKEDFPDLNSHFQDDRAVLVYLTLRYPEKYYFFKSKMFKDFCKLTGFWEFEKKTKENPLAKVDSFLQMADKVRQRLIQDNELLSIDSRRIPAGILFNDNHHLLTQDFIYSVTTYLNNKQSSDFNKEEFGNNNTLMSLNQILFGPPGTGKTYHTVNEAIRITDPKFYEENRSNRKKLKERFRELLIKDWKGTQGQIAFCTFHQSFSYEDFVEGIKPVNPQEGDTYLKYQIEDGIFKKICRLSEDDHKSVQLKSQRVISWNEDTFKKAVFYKVSLGNSNKDDDQAIYAYCIKNNCIAIGYGDEINFTGLDEEAVLKKCKEMGQDGFAGQAVNRFIHYLKEGNYVLVSNGNRYVRAIGKVTGPYRFEANPSINFHHYRPVEWLLVDKDIPVADLYDRALFQQTIYKLDEDGITKDFFVNTGKEVKSEAKTDKNYVLIIDEINRGNVSSIFGELITLIEKDKRASSNPDSEELEVTLPYSKEPFKVPHNVYIIGTMNTADRSVEALDIALRRRFSFQEMPSKPELIKTDGSSTGTIESIDLVKMLTKMNERIEKLIDKDHQIGHAYFMDCQTMDDLKGVFHNKVIPLLQEYFFGDFGKIGLVLGDSFVEVGNNQKFSFAQFTGYTDESVKRDLASRPVYKIKDSVQWNFSAIYEPNN